MERLNYIARAKGRLALSGAPAGYDAFLAAEAATRRNGLLLFATTDDMAAENAAETIAFFAPKLEVLNFPAWDCLPYDRVSPKSDIESTRLATLAALAKRSKGAPPVVVVAPVHALLQRVPPRAFIRDASFVARVGDTLEHETLGNFLVNEVVYLPSVTDEASPRTHRPEICRSIGKNKKLTLNGLLNLSSMVPRTSSSCW